MKKTISCFTISILSLFLGSFAVIQSDWFQEYSPDVLSRGKILHQIPPSSTSSEYTLSSIYPYLVLWNTTAEDIEGGRESDIIWYGEDSDGTRSTLARIRASHDGTSKDQKADLRFYTNDGSDNDAPTERMRLDADGDLGLGTTDPSVPFEMAHTSPGILTHNLTETDADEARSSFWQAQGEQSGGELSTLGKIQISHDGTSDDQKGQIDFYVNDGDDDDTPGLVLEIRSDGLKTSITETITTLGIDAGKAGTRNTFLGYKAGTAITTGQYNFFAGDYAGRLIETGTGNMGIGSSALYNTGTSASYNVAIGTVALGLGDSGNSRVAIGYHAGDRSRGNNSIFIGYQAGDNVTSGQNNLIIGYDNDAPSATGNNQIDIADVIFGNSSSLNVTVMAGMTLAKVTADPCGDTNAFPEASVWYNDTADILCICDGGGDDVKVSDGSACF